jgi:hypothetical protein
MPNPFFNNAASAIKDNSRNPFNKLNSAPVAKAPAPVKTVFNSNPFTNIPVSKIPEVSTPIPKINPVQNAKNIFAPQGFSSKDNPLMEQGYQVFGRVLPTKTSIKAPVPVNQTGKSQYNPFSSFDNYNLPKINTNIGGSTPMSIKEGEGTNINDVIGAPFGFLGGAIGGAIGAVGGSIVAQNKGLKTNTKEYWDSVANDSVSLAKEMYKNGSDVGAAGTKLGVATAVAPALVAGFFTAMTGKGIFDTIIKTKQYSDDLKASGDKNVGLYSTYKLLQNGGAEGFRMLGLDEQTINSLNDNDFFNAVGNVLLYGGAFTSVKGLKSEAKPFTEKYGKLSDFLTKDKIIEYKLPETVKISPQEVFDIYSGKANYEKNLSTLEKSQFLKELNLTREEINSARSSGISIEKPTEVIIKMADKPWFAKIKKFLNIEPVERVVGGENLGVSKKAPAGLIEDTSSAPKEFTFAGQEQLNQTPQAIEPISGLDFKAEPTPSIPANLPINSQPVSMPESIPSNKITLTKDFDIENMDDPRTIKARYEAELLSGIENSQAGRRIILGSGIEKQVITESSTFPAWIPDKYRKSAIIQPVIEHIKNGTLPTSKPQLEFYNIIKEDFDSFGNEIESAQKEINADEIDFGTAEKMLAEDEKLLKQYDQQEKSSAPKSESVSAKETNQKVGTEKVVPLDKVRHDLIPIVAERVNKQTPKILKIMESLKAGEDVPAIPVYEENGMYVINNDGFHRLTAHQNLGLKNIKVRVEEKTTLSSSAKQKLEHEGEFASAAPGAKNKTSEFLKDNRNVSDVKVVDDFVVSVRAKKVLTDLGIKSAEKLQGPRNLGVYKTLPNKARFKSLYDVITVAHEGAHGVDINNGLIDSAIANKDKDVLPSLKRAYFEYYPGASQSKRAIIQLREGFAEFIENYFTNPNDVASKYPKLVEAFITPEGKYYHKQTTQLLDGMNSLVEDFQKMTPEQRIGSKMRSGDEVVKEDKGFNTWQNLKFNVLNYTEPLARYVKETGTDPLSFANPQIANYNWSNRNAIAGSWISNPKHVNIIVDSRGNGRLISRPTGTVKDYLHLVKGKEKEFDEFLISRRVIVDNEKLTAVQNRLSATENLLAEIKQLIGDKEIDPKIANQIMHVKAQIKNLTEQRDLYKEIIEKDDFNVHDARSVVEKYNKEFEVAAKIHDNIWRNLLEFSYSNNLITSSNYSKWAMEDGYASFKRYIDDDLAASAEAGTGTANFISVSVFKNRGGSGLDLLSPTNSQIRAIFEIIPKALENTMWVKTYELTNKTGNKELAARFEEVTPNDPRTAANNPKLLTVKIDGKSRFFRPAEEFVSMRKAMSDVEMDTLSQLLLIPTRIFTRATTAANPYFLLGNISIDQFSRAYNTEHGTNILDVGKALGKFIINSQKDNIQNYKMLGGYHQTFAGAHDVRKLSPNELTKKIRNEAKTKTQKVINALEFALEIVETPSRISEMGTRFAEFDKAIKDGMTESEAMWAAANVSVNFGQHGAAWGGGGRWWLKSLPFLNPSIQGTYLFAQKVKQHPGRAASLTAQIAVLSLAATIVTMEAMDEEMKRKLSNVSVTELSKYIYIPMPKPFRDKTGIDFAKLKIPEIVGSTVGLAQLFVISNYSGNEAAFRDYMNVATSWIPKQFNLIEPIANRDISGLATVGLSWIPQFGKPLIMTSGNIRDYPDIMPILSDTMKNKPLAMQYNNNTSRFAKEVGPAMGVSPIKLDYWIKSQFGAAGKYATQGIGMPSTLVNADQYLTVGRVYQKFFEQKQIANEVKQTVAASDKSSKNELYTSNRDNLMFNHLGNMIADISEITKDKLEIPEKLKEDVNSLLLDVTNNNNADVIATYEKLADVNKQIAKFKIDNNPGITTDGKLKILKENLSTERSIMVSSYEEAYRKYNQGTKPTNELPIEVQTLLTGLKKKIINAGGSEADITGIKEDLKLEVDANAEYKAKRKMLENLPEQVKKQNPEIYQEAKDEKNALKK